MSRAVGASHKVFLMFIVPAFFLGLLEGSARLMDLSKRFAADTTTLDMPTWLLQEQNSRQKASQIVANRKQIDWLDIFEPGQGYRVHLVPSIDRQISNTFSMIPENRGEKYHVKANSLGFRGAEPVREKQPNEFRVLVFGDSSSFGWGVDEDDSFSAVLAKALKAKLDRPVSVYNFAIPGDSSEYGRLIFDRFASEYRPDFVILGFGANDAKLVLAPHTAQVHAFREQPLLQSIHQTLSHLELYRAMRQLMVPQAKTEAKISEPRHAAVPPRRYRNNLALMGLEARDMGAMNGMMLTLCTPSNYAAQARRAARGNGFLFLNGQRLLTKSLKGIMSNEIYPEEVEAMRAKYGDALNNNRLFYISSDGCHPNRLGHRLVGERIAALLEKRMFRTTRRLSRAS